MKLAKFNSQIPSLIDEIFKANFDDWFTQKQFEGNSGIAPVNISENEQGYSIELFAPGMKKENFQVEIQGNTLIVKGEITKEEKNYKHQEFVHSAFSRSFELPKTVQTESIEASYNDGILHIFLAKTDEAKEKHPKLIEVK